MKNLHFGFDRIGREEYEKGKSNNYKFSNNHDYGLCTYNSSTCIYF